MDTNYAYKKYTLVRTNIQLTRVFLESVNTDIKSNMVDSSYINDLSLGVRTEYVDEKVIDGYLKINLVFYKDDSDSNINQLEVIHRGRFESKEIIDRENFEDWVEVQVVPQLLPYARNVISDLSAKMAIPPITLPTMDILESMKANSEDDENVGDSSES